jgi:hypothetical protein
MNIEEILEDAFEIDNDVVELQSLEKRKEAYEDFSCLAIF